MSEARTVLWGRPSATKRQGPAAAGSTSFEGGAIYWTPQTGAHFVADAILSAWEFGNGGAGGPLGYPTGDPAKIANGTEQHFRHGTITDINGQPHVRIQP